MDDNAILDLYFARDERGLTGAAAKYGGYCSAIAINLLGKIQDAEECVNDTWLGSWRAIPPTRPLNLRVYLGRLCRNLALNRLRYSSAQKRGGGSALLEELEECLSGGQTPDQAFDAKETGAAISRFLEGCDPTARTLFLRRYWYGESVADAARFCGLPVGTAKSTLSRTRTKLKEALEKEGVCV